MLKNINVNHHIIKNIKKSIIENIQNIKVIINQNKMIKNTTIINLEDLVEKDLNPDKNLNQDKNHHLLIDKEEKINIRKR